MYYKKYSRISGIITIFALIISACSIFKTTVFSEARPNIVIILTDDMDLGLMANLTKTDSLIRKEGATFTNFFVTSPVCCPSRVSLLRGQYPHNTQILSNIYPDGGFDTIYYNGGEASTLAVWLENAGYSTSLIGKYLNGYRALNGVTYTPPGWTDWHVFLYQTPVENDDSNYFNFLLNDNGKTTLYGSSPNDYSTDVIRRKSIEFINQSVDGGSPFFIVISVYAPHGPSIPAQRHAGLFSDLVYSQSPSFNEDDINDKPSMIRELASNGEETDVFDANRLYLQRVRSMQAVDELVEDVVRTLEQNGQLDNTYIIFTSDNGFHIGEHGLPPGKATPYEEDIHVPFLIRGPEIRSNTKITQMAANIDIAPTIIELTGIQSPNFLDGRSLVPLLKQRSVNFADWRRGLLIEMGTMGISTSTDSSQMLHVNFIDKLPIVEFPDIVKDNALLQINTGAFRGVRSENFIYLEHETGEVEYYDLLADPYELENAASNITAEYLLALHSWLMQLQNCTADGCRKFEVAIPENIKNH